ncbi:peptidase M28 [Blastopirellula marina]|uniref:Peptidase M28 n=1 Tax=Blastopirellula marina TaxID=124 RepID=A0A2S8FGU2_9BACT|nr:MULTISPECIES: M28 family peptidase [Pirellulaceae]PQO31398.1 peptidase M28 [Blastopirellula marina]RCS51792.1 M20/M25/M40 family metallo-hydrolase [Bremerella cremea]
MTFDHSPIRERLHAHVDRLSGQIGPRILARPESISATIGYLTSQWNEMGYEVREETYASSDGPATNLVVEIPGTSANEVIVLGAHYDTVATTPGADDNASAVAVLLEVGRLLKEVTPRRTIRFVAFACEESPYMSLGSMGSQHHAQQARQRGEKIAMLCLEMVGYFRDDPGSQSVPSSIPKFLHWLFPKRGNFLAAIGNLSSWQLSWAFRRGFKKASRLKLFSICLPEKIEEIRRSDNSSFWDAGYPALMLTDTSFLRNANYHQPSDTPDTLDYDAMSEVTRGVASAVKKLAG